ncbi:phosphate/phosphite/phosphonate ABC transporter substrate-binding protein [Bacillus sp. PK3_68]|uniref:phosphate/phosphite/phosphonate ABC transporter substrate-binding protein n=1 Tax=Bacillus sp. PK3_68 TaxID=2027408 RepID=UPI000E76D5AD|nr:phosphate/phosphite/phosphonate ABC transporter substrate-binding protein [Bacillus sp. PK3_68]RJS50069.1 phosphate ABC transporter substrate-binding protein [Bacillus sp. PK3_68]
MSKNQQTLTIGAVAYDPKVVTIWDMMRSYFQENNFPVDYVLFSNYEAQVDSLLNGFIDIAWNTNIAYVRVQNALDGKAKVLAMRDTDINFTTKIIARTDRGIQSLSDLYGKKVAFGSADSGQAAILPYHFLKKNGLDPEKDIQLTRFDLDVGKHGDTGTSEYEVLRALKEGEVDAGAVGESTWIRMIEQGLVNTNEIKGIWTSPGYSHCNFTVLPDFQNDLAQKFTNLLLAMDPNQADIRKLMELEGLNEWVTAEGEGIEGYNVIYEAMEDQSLLANKEPVVKLY